jgi:sugar/nucleoside kinase (ribokinase family)
LKDAKIVDTTGAGDAFIGGYLISRIALEENKDEDEKDKNIVQFALEMGSFVGGKKLAGPGARTALPTSKDIDLLGSDLDTVKQSLGESLGPFAE